MQIRSATNAGVPPLDFLASHQAQCMPAAIAGKCEFRHNDVLAQITMSSLCRLQWIAVVAFVGGLLACGGKMPATHYYALDLPAPSPAEARLEHTAVLMPVRAGQVIGQGRIVYRQSPEEVGFYEYHRWAEDPEDSVASALIREMLARGTFSTVVPFDGRTKADFALRAELRRLEEIDYGGPVRAVFEISLELVNAGTQAVDWSSTVSITEDVPLSEVRSVVSRMSAAARQGIQQLSEQLDRHLRSGD